MNKKLLIFTSIAILLCGCSVKRDTSSSSLSSSTTTPISSSVTPEPSSSSVTPEPSSSSEKPEPISSSTIAPDPSSSTIKPEPSSSSVVPPSPSSSSIKPTPSSSSSEGHEHVPEEKWSHDENNHWHECVAHDGAKLNFGAHEYDSGKVVTEPTYSTKGTIKYTCTVCSYSYIDDIPALGYEACCDDMNEELAGKSFFDVFEIKEYLYSKNFDPELKFETDKFFGYDLASEKVVIYTIENGIEYPSNLKTHKYVSFQTRSVATLSELTTAVIAIGTGEANYSSIKLNADISISSSRIGLNSAYPIELDLNNHKIETTTHRGDIIAVNNSNGIVAIKNGTISTIDYDLRDHLNVYPSCVFVESAKTARVTNCVLNSRAQRGYGILDALECGGARLKINNDTINARLVAVATQKANYQIIDCTINGCVAINGGEVNISGGKISSKFFFDEEQSPCFVTNQMVVDGILAYLETPNPLYDKYIYSSTDAVIVLDRRSEQSTYSSPIVSISGTRLVAYSEGNNVYGYGFRYVDLNRDPNKSTNNIAHISLDKVIYEKCTASSPKDAVGGYSFFERSK